MTVGLSKATSRLSPSIRKAVVPILLNCSAALSAVWG